MNSSAPPSRNQALRSLVIGGILPVVAFTLVEEYYGTLWGLIAGMAFGVGEILWEWVTSKKVDAITWIGNGILIVLGTISLFTNEGIFFKLQPAILEAATAVLLVGSVAVGRPLLIMMAHKQGVFSTVPPQVRASMEGAMKGFTLRLGIFFLLHAALAVYSALYWSTRAWAILKGVGFTGSLVVYMLAETVVMRRKVMAAAMAARYATPVAPPLRSDIPPEFRSGPPRE